MGRNGFAVGAISVPVSPSTPSVSTAPAEPDQDKLDHFRRVGISVAPAMPKLRKANERMSHVQAVGLALMGAAVAVLPACTNTSSTPAAPSRAAIYVLVGGIGDDSTRRGIAGARVEVVGGINAGKFAVTNSSGEYSIENLAADSFRVRASAAGYDAGEQGVELPANPRADFLLKPGCAYTVSPTTPDVSNYGGGYTVAITRTTGTCGWQARASHSWVSLLTTSGSPTDTLSGSGTDTLRYTVMPNSDGTTRTGSVTIAWSGGSATVTFSQATLNCGFTVSFAQQSDVLPTGDTRGFRVDATGDSYCEWRATSNADWITIVSGASGRNGFPVGVQYRVDPNPSGTPRSGTLTVSWGTGSTRFTVTQFGACTYSISPSGTVDVPPSGGQVTVKMTRTLGACLWEAFAYDFISVSPGPASGGDGGTFTITVAPNSTGTSRFGCVPINLGFNTGGVTLRTFFYTGITVRQVAPGSAGSSPECFFRPPLTE